jgi:syntaxin 7
LNAAEIQRQIGEVNEMFQDLAVLINDQGQQLATVDQQIATTAERTHEGQRQLVKAERSQRSARNKCLMLWLLAGVVLAVILIVLFA